MERRLSAQARYGAGTWKYMEASCTSSPLLFCFTRITTLLYYMTGNGRYPPGCPTTVKLSGSALTDLATRLGGPSQGQWHGNGITANRKHARVRASSCILSFPKLYTKTVPSKILLLHYPRPCLAFAVLMDSYCLCMFMINKVPHFTLIWRK